jgi:hypothetical protein
MLVAAAVLRKDYFFAYHAFLRHMFSGWLFVL